VADYTDIRYSDITACIDSVSARAGQLEDRRSPNELCDGEQCHSYIIRHQISPKLTSCDRIHAVMSLYLMSVYSVTRSQFWWDWVTDSVSKSLLSITQFIWRPSVFQFSCSATDSWEVSQGLHCIGAQCLVQVWAGSLGKYSGDCLMLQCMGSGCSSGNYITFLLVLHCVPHHSPVSTVQPPLPVGGG